MRTFPRISAGLLLVLALVVITGIFWGLRHGGAAETAKAEPKEAEHKPLALSEDDARRAGLSVKRLEAAPAVETVELFGTAEVSQNRLAKVVSPAAGRIATVRAQLGDTVKPGDMLAQLDSSESGDARAAYAQAQSELALAQTSLARTASLVAAGSIARKEELKARADAEKARAALGAAAAKLKAFGLTPGAANGVLTLTAPLAGSVVEKTAVAGEHVQAYQALFSIGDLSTLWIQADVYERDLGRVGVGDTAEITAASLPQKRVTGKVTYVSGVLDRETRTAKARIELANPGGALRPGMFVNVSVAGQAKGEVLEVPETALLLVQGQMTAFVRDGEGFAARPVETGARHGGRITVTSGLEAGDEVVVAGAYALKARLLKSQIGDAD